MFSLKRPGYDDIQSSGQIYPDKRRSREESQSSNFVNSEIPASTNSTWEGMWGELLSSDVMNEELSMHLSDHEAGIPLLYNTEDRIESWAADNLPSSQTRLENMPLYHESSSTEDSQIETRSNPSHLLCYGMIYRASVQVVGDMMEIDSRLKSGIGSLMSNHCTFDIEKMPDHLSLVFQDKTEFGILNKHISGSLRDLIDQPLIQFDVIGNADTIREAIGRATKAKDATIRVNINVYGPSETIKEIGNHLSESNVYLQRPDTQRPDSIYDNPHFLKIPNMTVSNFEIQSEVETKINPIHNKPDHLQKTVSDVYASLTRGLKLNSLEGDRRLKTQLLLHQKEALDFMVQREFGPISPEFCLWKPVEDHTEGWYCHAVTKARSRIQSSETGGGILADEMGMGKSLSILALITKTIERSNDWLNSPDNDISNDSHRSHRRSRATLVIVPSAMLINEWLNEINLHLDGTLKTVKYHGLGRKTYVPLIEEVDMVFTTYHTLVAEFTEKSSPLYKVNWFRVVLDEAHIIRRQATNFNRAVSELESFSRWCLTGTPIQNRLEDVGALFVFLRVKPFHNIAMFRRFVSTPFEESEERRVIAIRNLTLLLNSLCLRRSRDVLHLPEPREVIRYIDFSNEERQQYENTKQAMNRALRQRASESHSKNVFGMFQIQLQLRILCNHGTYQHEFFWTRRSLMDEREDALYSIGGTSEVNCSACRQSVSILESDKIYKESSKSCGHVLCSECLGENEQRNDKDDYDDRTHKTVKCPLCTISGTHFTSQHDKIPEDQNQSYLRQEGYSSKVNAIISDVQKDLFTTKSIIFSCWTNTLDLIAKHLKKNSIPFYMINGDSPLTRRQRILDNFSKSSDIPVLIMTTGTGAFGLNLTSANRVFIIEPQWNPSVENQAIARALRMRQEKSVLITRYVVNGTVEQEMRSQQGRKLRIAEIGKNRRAD